MAYCVAKYSFPAQEENRVPAARAGDRFTIVRQHTNGWLEVRAPDGIAGFLPPAWVELEPGAAQFLARASAESGDAAQEAAVESANSEQVQKDEPEAEAVSEPAAPQPAAQLATSGATATSAPLAADTEDIQAKDDPESSAPLRKGRAVVENGEAPPGGGKRISNRVSLDFSAQLESRLQQTLSPNAIAPKKVPPVVPTRSVSAETKSPEGEGASPRKPHRMAPPPPVARRPDIAKPLDAPQSPAPSGAPAGSSQARPAPAGGIALPVAGVPLPGLSQLPQQQPPQAQQQPPQQTSQAPPSPSSRGPTLSAPAVTSEPPTPSVLSPPADAAGEDMSVAEAREIQEATGYEALLDRRVLLEDGKEPKKSRGWVTHYAVLAGPALYFFKDEKEKRKKKKYLSMLFFEPKHVSLTSDPARRGNVIVITTEKEKVMLHASDEEAHRRWTAALVPANAPMEDALQRTGTVSGTLARPVSGGSVAALSPDPPRSPRSARPSTFAVPEEDDRSAKKDSTFVRYLNKYLRSRPAKEDLKRKGIIEDAMFGSTIQEQVAKEREQGLSVVPDVPLIVVKCVQVVDMHLSEQGIYRVSGNASQIQKLVGHANADVSKLDLASVEDTHAVTGLLKLFFRELSDPVFQDALYADFIAAAKIADKSEKHRTLRALLHQLLPENRATLRFLIAHLTRVSAQGDVNKMQVNNLGIVFGPTLLRRVEPTPESIIMDSPFQSGVVEELLREPSLLD